MAIESLLKTIFDPQSPVIREIADSALVELFSLEKIFSNFSEKPLASKCMPEPDDQHYNHKPR